MDSKYLTPKDTSKVTKREVKNWSDFFTWGEKILQVQWGKKKNLHFKIKLWSLQIKADLIPSSERGCLKVHQPLKELCGIADLENLRAPGQGEGSKGCWPQDSQSDTVGLPFRVSTQPSTAPCFTLCSLSVSSSLSSSFSFSSAVFFFFLLHLTHPPTGHNVAQKCKYAYFC